MVIETHGPYGRKEEPNWKVELASRKSVRQVTIFVRTDTKFACGIEFVVADQNGNRKRHLIGNNNTKHKDFPTVSQPPIIMGDKEYLAQIHGMYFTKNTDNVPGPVISVGINTNLRKIEAYGEEGTQYKSSHKVVKFETPPLVDDDSILEIISTTKNSYNIRNIGVRIKTDTVTYGPYGAVSSLPVQKLVLDNRESVRKVIIYTHSTGKPIANGIEFEVADKNGSRTHHLLGLKNEDTRCIHQIILDSDEYLTQIYGTYLQQVDRNFSEYWILSFSIYTNIRRYEPIGNGSGYTDTKAWKQLEFESPPLSDDECLVEIHATPYSNVIRNIGVRIRKKGADTSTKTTKDDKGKHSASIDIKPILKRLDAQDEMAIDIKPILKRLDAQDEMVKKVMNAQDEIAKKISAQDEMMKKMMEVITGLSKKFYTKKHKKLEKKLDEIDVSVSTLTRITQIGFASVACAKKEENDDEEEEDVKEEESGEEYLENLFLFNGRK